MPDRFGNYQNPKSGKLPEAGKRVLNRVYQKERKSGLNPVSSARIAWAAVKNAGYKELKSHKWVKN